MDMEELKQIFAKNLTNLRKSVSLTQAELADKLNYSDKAISKWERGDAIPDVYMVKTIAEMFNVSVDYMLTSHTDEEIKNVETTVIDTKEIKMRKLNHIMITAVSVLGIWVLATILFVIFKASNISKYPWMMFIYPIPISLLVAFIFTCIWGRRLYRLISLSIFGWTILFTLFMILYIYAHLQGAWLVFLVGIPMEIVMLLSFGIDKIYSQRKELKKKVNE